MMLSIDMVINLTVLMIGQMMLTLSSPQTFPLFMIAAILFLLAAPPVAVGGQVDFTDTLAAAQTVAPIEESKVALAATEP